MRAPLTSGVRPHTMNQPPIGHRIGALIAIPFRPVKKLFCWWFSFTTRGGATYFVMPDGYAIFGLLLMPSFFFPGIYIEYFWLVLVGILISPFLMLSLLRIQKGKVMHVNLFLFLPYWVKRVPEHSIFELYEAWGDPAPSGVAFTLPPNPDAYLHIGTTTTAKALEQAVGAVLRSQGWTQNPKWPYALSLDVLTDT